MEDLTSTTSILCLIFGIAIGYIIWGIHIDGDEYDDEE